MLDEMTRAVLSREEVSRYLEGTKGERSDEVRARIQGYLEAFRLPSVAIGATLQALTAKRRMRMSACSLWPAMCSRAHRREQYSPTITEASSVRTRW